MSTITRFLKKIGWLSVFFCGILFAAASPKNIGVSVDVTGAPLQAVDDEINAIAQNGFDGVRLRIPWKSVEPLPHHFDFTVYDEAIRRAAAAHLDILATLAFPPPWAAGVGEDSDDARTRMMPNNLNQWAKYVSAVVKRYHKRIHQWQIWEKPSIENFQGTDEDYFELLRFSYPMIKKIEPDAEVFASEPGGPDLGFIQNLLSVKNRDAFDGIALVPELDSPFQFSEYETMLRDHLPAGNPKKLIVTDWKLPAVEPNQNMNDEYLQGAYTTAAPFVERFFSPRIFDFNVRKTGMWPEPDTMPGPACVTFLPAGDNEDGLYTQKFRTMQKANPAAVQEAGTAAAEFSPNDNPFLYVDVDDRFIFFNPDRRKIKITVRAAAFDAGKKAGMNLMYDSARGYVFSPWITIAPGAGWKDYEWILTDAEFADKGGFDFRLSDLGSEQTVYVSKLCVDKL